MRAQRALLLVGAGLWLLAGCAGTEGVRRHDDGTISIDCGGGYYDWSACHRRAAAVCAPGRFDIVSQVSDEASQGVGTRDWSAQGSEVKRTLRVRCTG